jgi:two-component system, OmpR family, sensor histidine kinase CpxA
MRSLILKIFLCYWIAASVVIFVIDLNPHEQMHRPEATEALASALRIHAHTLLQVYEAGGCTAAAPLLSDSTDTLDLASPDGTVLCSPVPAGDLHSLIRTAATSKLPIATNFRNFQVVALSVESPSGKPYVMLLKNRFSTPIFFGLVPGTTTLIISGVVTLLLAVLIAVPIRRLRCAARDIANGRLEARAQWGKTFGAFANFPSSDVLSGLIVDFNHMAERLQSLVAAQRVLFRDISHELRSPLARLSVALELAREAGPASMKAPLDRIEVETARVNDLISQLLSLSYMETVQELSQSASFSLGDLVRSVLPDVQYEADRGHCHVIARTLHDCPVYGDPILLHRAIENVVRNAIRYTPENGVVEIDVKKVESNGSWLAVVRVADDGPGVPADELTSILLPFYRVDKSRQRATGGYGVGLAIADRAVKLHSGEIRATNKPEGGLVVEMTFPFSLRPAEPRNERIAQ